MITYMWFHNFEIKIEAKHVRNAVIDEGFGGIGFEKVISVLCHSFFVFNLKKHLRLFATINRGMTFLNLLLTENCYIELKGVHKPFSNQTKIARKLYKA